MNISPMNEMQNSQNLLRVQPQDFLCETLLFNEVCVYLASLFFFMLKWIQLSWAEETGPAAGHPSCFILKGSMRKREQGNRALAVFHFENNTEQGNVDVLSN